jgi:carbon storage regulator
LLVLSRKRGERFRIGEGANTVIIDVIDIREGNVRLGIKAPREIRVDRLEVHAATEASRQAAREGKPCD